MIVAEKIPLVKGKSGTRWHYGRPGYVHCHVPMTIYIAVRTWTPWLSPVKGHTCVKCQPIILSHLHLNMMLFVQTILEISGDNADHSRRFNQYNLIIHTPSESLT